MTQLRDHVPALRGERLTLRLRLDGAQPSLRGVFAWDIQLGRRRIGQATLQCVDQHGGEYGIGIDAAPDRGRGYGTEVTRLVLAYAFDTLQLPRVRLVVAARNQRARACYTRCGFIPVLRWRDGRDVTLVMICPNPVAAPAVPLTRSLLLSPAALRGRRVQLNRGDLAFLDLQPGDPVTVELVAGDLLLRPAETRTANLAAIPVDLTEDEHAQLVLAAAHLGMTPATLIGEVLACPSRSATAA